MYGCQSGPSVAQSPNFNIRLFFPPSFRSTNHSTSVQHINIECAFLLLVIDCLGYTYLPPTETFPPPCTLLQASFGSSRQQTRIMLYNYNGVDIQVCVDSRPFRTIFSEADRCARLLCTIKRTGYALVCRFSLIQLPGLCQTDR